MSDRTSTWTLKDFLEQLDVWNDLEKPSDDLRIHVTAWIISRADDPYQGARREPGFPNLWYVAVPRSYHDGAVVVCSYEIVELVHEVRCKGFGTLGWPV